MSEEKGNTASMVLTWNGVKRGALQLAPMAWFVATPFGIGFGVAAIQEGLSPTLAILMSVSSFAGAAQFAALDLWGAPFAFLTLGLLVFAINARYLIMGAALSPWVKEVSFTSRIASLALLSDNNFANSHLAFKNGERDVGILLGGGLILWIHWSIGTTIGTIAGSTIGNLSVFGLDVILPCFFAAIVAAQLRSKQTFLVIIIAAFISVTTLTWLPNGWNVVLAALVGGVVRMVVTDE